MPGIAPLLLVAPALLAAMALAGCQSDAERAREAMALAQQLAAAGQYAAAQGQFDIAVRLRDDQPEWWLMRARNQVALDNYAGAYASYRNVLDQDRTNREALDAMAQLSLASNRMDDARSYGEQILALAPEDPTGLLVQASVAFHTGRYDGAGQIVERLLTIAPGNEQALVLHARLLHRRGQVDAALAGIEPVFRASGGSDALRALLVELYGLRADGAGLLAVAARDAADRPRDAKAQSVLGLRRSATGDLAGGLSAFDAAHTLSPGDEQRAATARALAHADVSPAQVVAALAARSAPQGDLVLAVAAFALDRGDADAATKALGLLDGAAGSARAVHAGMTAHAAAMQGRMAEARRSAAAALAIDGGQPYALMARALAGQAAGNSDGALRDARQAASENNQFALGQAVLARILAARGDRILADKALFDANIADKADPNALRQLGAMLVARGRAADAALYARRFTLRQPDSVAGWTIRRSLCVRLADRDCADRAAALAARLRGRDVPLPATPADERPGVQDYRDIYRDEPGTDA